MEDRLKVSWRVEPCDQHLFASSPPRTPAPPCQGRLLGRGPRRPDLLREAMRQGCLRI
uniref:Uncharacterized protein n=1 Tax=Arundo donax TaxID=35708 RepID=A0A0A9BWP3_ARUDO